MRNPAAALAGIRPTRRGRLPPVLLGLVAITGSGCGGDSEANPFAPATEGDATGGTDAAPEVCLVDGVRDGAETDVDCGGGTCPACADGQTCLLNADCQSTSCQSDVCSAPSCSDGGRNQDETDFDCGGSCPPCATGEGCVVAADCESGVCEGGTCSGPSCSDGLHNGDESDLDCGGPICAPCGEGSGCFQNADCTSGYCMDDTCTAKTCRSDADCTELDGPCAVGACHVSMFVCVPEATNEGLECDDGDPCTLSTTCTSARCAGGTAPDCTALDDVCTVGVCNRMDGSCEAAPANEGGRCDDADPCTAGDACVRGACTDPDGPDVHLDEDFSDRSGGWTLGTDWEIGPAVASPVGEVAGTDPDLDATPTADNGVAGVLIGGLVQGSGPPHYLESPVLVLANAPGELELRLSRWLNADALSSTHETIEVWDGSSWVLLWENLEAVTADAAWTPMTFDLTPYKNDQLRIRIGHDGAGNAPAVAGWTVDDVRLAPPACP